jgi:hypothetical protein
VIPPAAAVASAARAAKKMAAANAKNLAMLSSASPIERKKAGEPSLWGSPAFFEIDQPVDWENKFFPRAFVP